MADIKQEASISLSSKGSELTSQSSSYLINQNRTLHVSYDSWKGRSARILDQDKENVLYQVEFRNRKPQITLSKPALDHCNNSVVGTVQFNTFTRVINADINGHTFQVKSKNWKCLDLPWASPSFPGRTLMWKRKNTYTISAITLVDDETGATLARFSPGACSMKNAGTIELMMGDTHGTTEEEVDEIILTGLAVMQNTILYAATFTAAVVS